MNRLYITILILFITSSYCFSCQTDDDCNHGEGTCQSDHTCYCKWFYEGESCSIRWQDANPGWIDLWIFYCTYTCILQAIIIVLIIREIRSASKFRFNMVTIVLLLILLACVIRLVDYAVDGHDYYGRLTEAGDNVLYYVPILIWFFCYYLMMMHWIRITQASNLIQSQHFRKVYIFVIVMEVATILILLPAIIWESLSPIPASVDFLDFSIAALLIIASCLSFFAGRRLFLSLSQMTQDTKLYRVLLFKTKFVLAIVIPLAALIITLVIFTATDATIHPWEYVILHILLRSEEIAFVFCMLQIIYRRPLFAGYEGISERSEKSTELSSNVVVGKSLEDSSTVPQSSTSV